MAHFKKISFYLFCKNCLKINEEEAKDGPLIATRYNVGITHLRIC